ncbi:hypothetical protein NHX12_022859 [Muraenolepis orangiensis]|uniref:Cystatin domain-containing protein n=1 Tax=Muraenolepis orangiensis TaxID=630683 RepID=A0A9Q0IUU0_9TELE|nr:hypothetical protein NHX12_022859 [Muraenolepis orangiensis]
MTSRRAVPCVLAWFGMVALAVAPQPMTGEPRGVPANRTDVARAARFAVANFNEANVDDFYAYKILNVTSAKVQVVAGVKYILDVRLGRTSCERSAPSPEPCALQTDPFKVLAAVSMGCPRFCQSRFAWPAKHTGAEILLPLRNQHTGPTPAPQEREQDGGGGCPQFSEYDDMKTHAE